MADIFAEKEDNNELSVLLQLRKVCLFIQHWLKNSSYSEREFSEQVLGIQTSEHYDQKTIFHLIRLGNLDLLQKKLVGDPNYKFEVDAAGANVVHLAYLYGYYQMGHWLVERYPTLALEPYSDKLPAELQERFKGKKMLYTGENILHIVIVQRNYEEVRWLLDFYRDHRDSEPNGLAKLLMQSATGSFFEPGGAFYFGNYPLQFAVCCNSIEMFDLVLSFAFSIDRKNHEGSSSDGLILGPNVIFMRDGNGNTLLHLCVFHGLKDMYEHILSIAATIIKRELQIWYSEQKAGVSVPLKALEVSSGYSLKETMLSVPEKDKYRDWLKNETKRKLEERMLLVLNSELLSPLTLAAKLSRTETDTVKCKQRIEMINIVLSSASTKVLLWKYGPVSNYHVDLNGLDIEYDLAQYIPSQKSPEKDSTVKKQTNYSVITWLCCNEDCDAIVIPEIKSIIEKKWERYGRPLFIRDCVLDFTITVLVTLISIYVNTSPSISPQYGFEWFVNILYLVTVLVFLSVTFYEVWSLIRHPNLIFSLRGVAKYNMFCRVLKVAIFYVFIAFRIVEASRRDWKNSFIIQWDHSSHKYFHSSNVSIFGQHLSRNPTIHPTSYPNSFPSSFPTSIYNPQDYTGSKICLTLCVVVSWFNLYYYMTVFKVTGPFMLTFSRVVSHDVPYFMQFFFIPLLGFALCLSMLENNGTVQGDYAFWNTARTVWALLQKVPNMNIFIDPTDSKLVPSKLQWLSNLFLTSFYGFSILIMLNLLIAIMNNTYSHWSQYNEAMFLIENCNIMDFFDKHKRAVNLENEGKEYSTINNNDFNDKLDSEVDRQSTSDPLVRRIFEMQDVSLEWYNSKRDAALADENPKTSVFIIDPQRDFHHGGSLAVPGADADSQRIADMIMKNKHNIHEIFVSLDSHHPSHIAHAAFWVGKNNNNKPAPFTTITYKDIVDEVWQPRDHSPDSEVLEWCKIYTKALERKGRMTLTIWPDHCIIGSKGHAIEENINEALQDWSQHSKRPVKYVMKGQNCRTEFYSALEAEVVDPLDFSTALNMELISMLQVSERVISFNI